MFLNVSYVRICIYIFILIQLIFRWCVTGGEDTFKKHTISKQLLNKLTETAFKNRTNFEDLSKQFENDRFRSIKKLEKLNYYKKIQADKLKKLNESIGDLANFNKLDQQKYKNKLRRNSTLNKTKNNAMEDISTTINSHNNSFNKNNKIVAEWDDAKLNDFFAQMVTKDAFEIDHDEQDF